MTGYHHRVLRHRGVSRSDYDVYDVYGSAGQHWVEYECYINSTPSRPEEVEEPVEKGGKRLWQRLSVCKEQSKEGRGSPPILSPPGGWFFFRG